MARIGVFTRPVDQRFSGSGFHLERLLLALGELSHPHEIVLIHHESSDSPLYDDRGFRDVVVSRNWCAIARLIRRLNFDLVHHNPLSVKVPVIGHPARQVATVHSAEPLLVPECYGMARRLHYRFFVVNALSRMDQLVTVSRTTAEYLASRAGIDTEKFTVIYNSADRRFDDTPVPDDRRRRVREQCSIRGAFVLHVSRYSPRKNPGVLLRAFRRFLDEVDEPYQLVIAGSNWDNPDVRELARRLDIEDSLRLLGFTATEVMADLYRMADLFLNATLAEGFGMPNVEAMQSGCPVVTTGAFAVPEVVGDGALVVQNVESPEDLARAAVRVVSDRELRSDLVERGRNRASKFSWRAGAEKILDVYQRALRE